MLRASTASVLAALAALGALTACGHPAAHNPSNRAGAIATPDPAPEAGPEPTDVIDHLADGSDAPSICFGWAPETGAIICQVSQSSIQGGADRRLRFLRRGTTDVSYYHHPDDGDEGHATVVTEHRGPWRGHRVVRGREGECAIHALALGLEPAP